MKRLMMLFLVGFSLPVGAGYTYTVTEGMDISYLGTSILIDHQSLLMTGGGGGTLRLLEWSSASIQNTSPYNQDVYPRGGIKQLDVGDYAHLDLFDGDVYELNIGAYGTATISGGWIHQIASSQSSLPSPHITMVCSTYNYNISSKMLTGTWLDGSSFDIQLIDIVGYSKTIDNMTFIPEPATMLLLAIGGILMRRK